MERMTKIDENIQTAQNLLSWIVERCYELEEENKKLKEYNRKLKQGNDDLKEQNKKLKDDIKKWEDRWMVKLAEIYVMPTRELTTAIAKNEWFSSWYDTIKKQMLHELWFDRLDVQDLLKENKNLKKTIKDHQLYEEKLEHRIIELEELLHWE